jgi:sugar phosphate isomerase/epimerase
MSISNKFSNISLSAYAFGYGCGFIKDIRQSANGVQTISLDNLSAIAIANNLGGVEVPIDTYFKEKSIEELEIYLSSLNKVDLKLVIAFENFESIYFCKVAPLIYKNGNKFVRVKISNFYGGNRFKEANYKIDLQKFRGEVLKSKDILDKYNLKLLIENHQDITLKDIFDLVDEFGENRIGVNWDTGNSFPTGETVTSFLNKSIQLIGNVHLKDYRVQSSESGYVMHRCGLGEGIVNFQYLIKELYKFNPEIPFTIELGAMNGREAQINIDDYWQYTEGVTLEMKNELISFINEHLENDKVISTLWEQQAAPQDILESEFNEVIRSINFIKKIIKNL